ncbi:MAG: TetR/AcrR family transcriptional regulator C-terminal domain-containing protein [Candidatus Acidiferrum sp.]
MIRRALDILNEDGIDGLTMRRLAERMKIKAASLYNHVSGKDELLTLAADAICGELIEINHSSNWRAQLATVAIQFRRLLISHRDGARLLAATAPIGPNRLQIIECVLSALVRAGFSSAEATDASWVHNSYVVGFVLDEMLGRPSDKASFNRLLEKERCWLKSLPKERYPTLVSLANELVDATPDRRFEFGLSALLDGFELRLAKKRV